MPEASLGYVEDASPAGDYAAVICTHGQRRSFGKCVSTPRWLSWIGDRSLPAGQKEADHL